MTTGAVGITFFLACIFVGGMLLTGLLVLFVKAENIERNLLVGGLTLSTTLISLAVLDHDYRLNFPYGGFSLFWICVLAAAGFGIGRWLDYYLGGRTQIPETYERTLGADLSD